MNRLAYQIVTEKYQNNCFKISDSLVYFKRDHFRDENQLDTDVFADFWSLAFLPASAPQITLLIDDKEIDFIGPVYFFIPAHSIVKWRLPKGQLVWHALISTKKIQVKFLNPVAIPATIHLSQLKSEKLVEHWLNRSESLAQIGNSVRTHIIAEKTKAFIDLNYQNDFHISEISKLLQVSNAYLTKEFKKCFGLSPIKYRNKKRIFKAMQVLMFSRCPRGQLAHDVGFNDYSRFSKNFSQIMHASPSDFRLNSSSSSLDDFFAEKGT